MATGRKQVSPGQTIASAQWGNPLWDQSVQCFASAADRDTQYAAPHQGSLAWLEDVKQLTLHNGTGWVRIYPPGLTEYRGGYLLATTTALGAIPITWTSMGATPTSWFAVPAIASGSTWPNASVAVLQSSVGPTGMTAYVQKNTDGTNLASTQFRINWGAFL